ncbi:TVP38/TMEM64 family protein [Nocardiopsis eucommiae]|uniref:TVP38/TMEM64 family membrane protein n=1 Tax=Nocardiopsis eucommiae TaxID=2831970 RepID=A0A975LBF8_9ACTN|nr:TVP38/TMEM64 family protein [Nocardiopsis eucommiae]
MGHRWGQVWRVALLAVWVAVLAWAILRGPDLETVRDWTTNAGFWGAVVYLAAYVLAVQALVPRPALNIAGGLLFGLVAGVVLALVGGVLAAVAQFAVARYVAGDALSRRLPERVRTRLEGLVGRRALLAVVQLRLIPVIPYQMVNYGFGLTGLRVAPFALGTALGSLPATAAMVVVGTGGIDLGFPVAVATGAAAALLALAWWLRSRRRRVREREQRARA